ncbi:hypothetical protein BJY04DRAFT_186468 [Aspergillus karnatakaensis]|uniref:uncharacterized protein n=1 Tax=Aspergillus karnatakaensis TaxID=1810916 RepID=UPI003CCCACE6
MLTLFLIAEAVFTTQRVIYSAFFPMCCSASFNKSILCFFLLQRGSNASTCVLIDLARFDDLLLEIIIVDVIRRREPAAE